MCKINLLESNSKERVSNFLSLESICFIRLCDSRNFFFLHLNILFLLALCYSPFLVLFALFCVICPLCHSPFVKYCKLPLFVIGHFCFRFVLLVFVFGRHLCHSPIFGLRMPFVSFALCAFERPFCVSPLCHSNSVSFVICIIQKYFAFV